MPWFCAAGCLSGDESPLKAAVPTPSRRSNQQRCFTLPALNCKRGRPPNGSLAPHLPHTDSASGEATNGCIRSVARVVVGVRVESAEPRYSCNVMTGVITMLMIMTMTLKMLTNMTMGFSQRTFFSTVHAVPCPSPAEHAAHPPCSGGKAADRQGNGFAVGGEDNDNDHQNENDNDNDENNDNDNDNETGNDNFRDACSKAHAVLGDRLLDHHVLILWSTLEQSTVS